MDLNTTWFLLIGVLLTGYAILDGFDLGVGVLHLFSQDDRERRVNLTAIGPVWDGNEVWLLAGGGSLFAAFPRVYATVFSSFYLPFMLLLLALIFRAVSFEFRSQVDSPGWRRCWDWAFGLGSTIPALLYGVAVGNILRGIPLNEEGVFTGSFPGLLNPYSLLLGLLSLTMFTMHGAAYMTLKTNGELRERMKRWASRAWIVFAALFILSTFATFLISPYLFEGAPGKPLWWLFLILFLGSMIYLPVVEKKEKYLHAFLASSLVITGMIGLAAVSIFPRLVPSITDLAYSLTIYNAASTPKAQRVILIIALIGMPLVIAYTSYVYWVFKGKVELSEKGY
ncbi:MAG: cytochrome d ubiquinol oxidase subunit II [Fidelibacterota bacterium]|nr:MAG: cytochrome d ubiquinol oxidase subunit II [Candidatus Neomarinimicrobiota bacterium]